MWEKYTSELQVAGFKVKVVSNFGRCNPYSLVVSNNIAQIHGNLSFLVLSAAQANRERHETDLRCKFGKRRISAPRRTSEAETLNYTSSIIL